MNLYKDIFLKSLSRLLNMYNMDPGSTAAGIGDRLYWGWKISDFPNGALQGGVHALAVAVKMNWVENRGFLLQCIDSAIQALPIMTGKKGALNEAYPGEDSYCVTAQVAFDTLAAVDLIKTDCSQKQLDSYLTIVEPLIRFISRNDETHAVISNHLASAVAAFSLWRQFTGEHRECGDNILARIFSQQSEEGWYREYEGADPGYQTLCSHFLYHVFRTGRHEALKQSLVHSARFLKYFVHPDGTLGGLYGSRNTEVYYPSGFVGMSAYSEEFNQIRFWMEKGIANGYHMLPDAVDIGNFVPLVNSYAVAAYLYEEPDARTDDGIPPPQYAASFHKTFRHAGIHIHSNSAYYAILNYKKGGCLKVFDKATGEIDMEDGGLFGNLSNGTRFSTQQYDEEIQFVDNTIGSNFYMVNESFPSPLTTIILRLLGISLFRFGFIGQIFKKAVVRKLMTGKRRIDGRAIRRFRFEEDRIIVAEEIRKPSGCASVGHPGRCMAIHMASSGYHLKQHRKTPHPSRRVLFETDKNNG
jgi:hypothetical protein